MEWRQQTTVSCAEAFNEAQRWIEEVTGKLFGCNDFRGALENGVLLCDLINKLKPGIIKRLNRLSTPIAGLDNVNVFLKGCEKLGLNDSQLFHPGDLQDLSSRVLLRRDESSRRLKNVLITIYWLGRKAHLDTFYNGPQLNFKAFEGLLGLALSKVLDDGNNVLVKDGGYRECRYPERDDYHPMRLTNKRQSWMDSSDSLDCRVLRPHSEGCGSDAEAEQVFKMENKQHSSLQNRGHVPPTPPPPPLRRKQGQEESGSGCASPLSRSKSLSDIPMVYPVRKATDGNAIYDEGQRTTRAGEWNQDNRGKCFVAAKDSEAQWQDDFTKWKNRRRSTTSEPRRKSQEREHVINQMTNGALIVGDRSETLAGLLKRDQQSPRWYHPTPQSYSTSPPSKSFSSDLRPHSGALLTRGHATEAFFSPSAPQSRHHSAHTRVASVGAMTASDGTILGEETHFATLVPVGSGVTAPSLDFSLTSQTQVKPLDSPAPSQSMSDPICTNQISTLFTTLKTNDTKNLPTDNRILSSSLTINQKDPIYIDPRGRSFPPDQVPQTGSHTLEDLPYQNFTKSQEEATQFCHEAPAMERKTQPNVQKYLSRTGSWCGSASLPRGFRRSEGSTRLTSSITAKIFDTKQSRVSTLPRLTNQVDDNHGLLLNSETEDSSHASRALKRQTATRYLKSQQQSSVTVKKIHRPWQTNSEQEKEGCGVSSYSQHSSQTTRPHLLIQPYSNLQPYYTGSPFTPSTNLPKVDHSDMRVSLELKPNSTPDFGFHTHWDSTGARVTSITPGSPAELCQLCVEDEIVAIDGVLVAHMNYNQWKGKMASALQTGSLTLDIQRYRNKDWNTSLENHHNLPNQSQKSLNPTPPPLIGHPDPHVNSTAFTETSVKVSNCNGQTDNITQTGVISGVHSDNPRTTKSKGGSESAISDLQVPSLSPSSSSWSWDHEEERRRQEKWQEEQERLLQEQYQRNQERLQAEWQKAQHEAMEGRQSVQSTFELTAGEENPVNTQLYMNGLTQKTPKTEPSPDGEELDRSGVKSQSNVLAMQSDKTAPKEWGDSSCGFAQLSPAHRTKSLSTSVLSESHKHTRGDQRKSKGQTTSKAEQERQQILEEMKKRTQLLTDNSWIRQRSSSFYKEPICIGVPMKRYDSLDDLDTLRGSPVTNLTFNYPRPHSAAAGYCAPTRNSYSRYSTGATIPPKTTSMQPSNHSGAWAAADVSAEQRVESRSESETGNPTVSPAISNSSLLVHSTFDQHAVLEIEE